MSQKWNAKVQFPTDSNFVNRIINVTFGPSNSSGNPMITLETEVVSPAEVEIGTEKYNIAGVTSKNYYTTKVMDGDEVDVEKTENAKRRVTELLTNLGVDTSNLNWDNLLPQIEPLKGKLILTMMSPDIEEQRKNPTAAQIEAAKKQGIRDMRSVGDIMKHPVTGKALVNYWPKVREIFGLAPTQDGVQVPY